MAYYLQLYFATLLTFFAIDMIWLNLLARSFYRKYLGFLMTPNPNLLVAIIFYFLFILGLLIFVIVPGLKENLLKTTLLRAALFGLITYGTYDLTNLATVKDWPLLVTIVDMAWGVVLSVIVCFVSYIIGRWLK